MPGLRFTIPNHAEEVLSRSGSALVESIHHRPPTFDAEHSEPILYLPPLLSSLPATYSLTRFEKVLRLPPVITETRLPDIDPASLSLHRALHHFRPWDAHYAEKAYSEAFNWSELELPIEEEREWFCVAFRSIRRDGSDGTPLYDADKVAHEEAIRNGGLIMYWYGVPDPETGLNLATCIWQSRQHAIAATNRPRHIEASRLAKDAYERYDLERWVLKKVKEETGLSVEPYNGGSVGW